MAAIGKDRHNRFLFLILSKPKIYVHGGKIAMRRLKESLRTRHNRLTIMFVLMLMLVLVVVTIQWPRSIVVSASSTWGAARAAGLQSEPPHPILSIPGTGSGANAILANYTEAQFLEYV